MAKYLLQTSSSCGTYKNPFKRGGQALRYSPWKTEGTPFTSFEEAKTAWINFNQSGLKRRRITFGGKTLITPEGAVYEVQEQLPTSAAWSETKRMEKVLVFKERLAGL